MIPWSPLARGRLTRPWEEEPTTERGESDQFGKTLYSATKEADRKVIEKLTNLSQQRGVPMAQLALAWMLHKSAVTSPIIGASKPHHLEDAVAALSIKLSPEEILKIEIATGVPITYDWPIETV